MYRENSSSSVYIPTLCLFFRCDTAANRALPAIKDNTPQAALIITKSLSSAMKLKSNLRVGTWCISEEKIFL